MGPSGWVLTTLFIVTERCMFVESLMILGEKWDPIMELGEEKKQQDLEIPMEELTWQKILIMESE